MQLQLELESDSQRPDYKHDYYVDAETLVNPAGDGDNLFHGRAVLSDSCNRHGECCIVLRLVGDHHYTLETHSLARGCHKLHNHNLDNCQFGLSWWRKQEQDVLGKTLRRDEGGRGNYWYLKS